ncbi:MAG: hypothetical protein HS132_07985 [Planctomycetia bacterium]|nr:hypothetical protein [Planctomycetia bacterium]
MRVSAKKINHTLFQAEEIVLEDAPYVWLYHAENVLLYKKILSNVAINFHNHWMLSEIKIDR